MPQGPLNALIGTKGPNTPYVPATFGKQNDLLVSRLHGEKYTATYNKASFSAALQSGVTTSAGLATTYVGLMLANPASSTVNLELRTVTGQFIVAVSSSPVGVGLIAGTGALSATTAVTGVSNIIGGATTPTGLVYSAATIGTAPTWLRYLGEQSGSGVSFVSADYQGGILVPPGAFVALGTTAAGSSSGFIASIEWNEYTA